MKVLFMSKKTVSVIIPTKNEERVINECLSFVFAQSLQPLEVIIVDGLSTDGTLRIAQQFPVKIITEKEPTSLPNARNLGIEKAKGDVILIMDADVILEENCIENAVKRFEDASIVAIIPCEKSRAHTRLEKIEICWLRGTANPVRSGVGIPSFVEFFRQTVFEKVRFDPNLGYGEDMDFQKRLKKIFKGKEKIVYSDNSTIYIHHPHTFKELRSQYAWYGRTFKTYFSKNPSIRTILNLGSLLAPTILIILCIFNLFFVQVLPLLLLLFALLVTRNIIACYRSKSRFLIEFIAYELVRSIFFVIGLTQGLFSKKRGK
jgi:glycosyltransferase involved in cell wall biosynthesis